MPVLMSDAVLFSFAAAGITTLGLIAVLLWRETTRRHAGLFAAFAAGALITISCLHLLPEALHMSAEAPAYLLLGFGGAYFLNSGVLALAQTDAQRTASAALLPVIAIAFHSMIDGVAYAVTFSVDYATGLMTVIGLMFHEIPEGIIVFTLLQAAGLKNRTAFLLAFLAAGLTTPLGAIGAQFTIDQLSEPALGGLFAFTAGILLYVSAGHLLPHVDHVPLLRRAPALFLGGMVGIGASLFHEETHGHGADHDHLGIGQDDYDHDHDDEDHDHDHDDHEVHL